MVSLKDKLRARFKVSVVEVEYQDLRQRGRLGVAAAGTSPARLREGLAAMRRLVEADPRCTLIDWRVKVDRFGDSEVFGDEAARWLREDPEDEHFGPRGILGEGGEGRGE